MTDAACLQELFKLITDIFGSVVGPEAFDGPTSLLLDVRLELNKCVKNFSFGLEKIHVRHTAGIFNEPDEIFASSYRWLLHRSA